MIDFNKPAFPVMSSEMTGTLAPGMSLLEYFAARAPAEPQGWFKPVMPERPKIPDGEHLTGKLKEEYNHLKNHDGDDIGRTIGQSARDAWDAHCKAAEACVDWDDEKKRQRFIQWPFAWARAVLAAGEQE